MKAFRGAKVPYLGRLNEHTPAAVVFVPGVVIIIFIPALVTPGAKHQRGHVEDDGEGI